MSGVFAAWTVLVFVLFVGIVVWVMRRGNRKSFDEAARIPLDDDEDAGDKHPAGD